MQRHGIPIDQAALGVIGALETTNQGGYCGPIPGLKQITLDKVHWLSKADIITDKAQQVVLRSSSREPEQFPDVVPPHHPRSG